MATLHLLREGTGNARVASSTGVQSGAVRRHYEHARVRSSDRLPTINPDNGPANWVSNPQFAIIEMEEGEAAFGDFRSPGFNLLYELDGLEVYQRLFESKA